MDIHNIDDYLDLQDQTETNLLATEQIASQSTSHEHEEEWHAVSTPLNDMLTSNSYFNQTPNWDVLNNTNRAILTTTAENFVTPEALIKTPTPPPPPPPPEQPEAVNDNQQGTRVTRSSKNKTSPAVNKKKKAETRAKKLYCICQKPYKGELMVQCDKCSEWFHCACVGFDPDEQDDEDIGWVCKACSEAVVKQESSSEEAKTTPMPLTVSTRQSRASRTQSRCLYAGCTNRTRADSFCSDVCARKQNETAGDVPEPSPTRPSRRTSMRRRSSNSAAPNSPVKKSPPQRKNKKKDNDNEPDYNEEEEAGEEDVEEGDVEEGDVEEDEDDMTSTTHGSNTPDTPMSPSQMTELENPVRRNVIKSLTNLLRTILSSTTADNASSQPINPDTVADELARSIENTMLQHLGTVGPHGRRTCGEPYKLKFRSLLYNLKDKANTDFQHRVVTGQLTPLALVSMSSEEMANPKLRSMSEVLRERGLKNSVMKLPDASTIVKKTHKGDVIVSSRAGDEEDAMYSAQVQQELDKANQSYQQQQQQRAAAAEEKRPSISSFAPASTSAADPLDDILARIGIPTTVAASNEDRTSHKRQDALETTEDPEAKKRKVTLDVEALLGEEDDYQVEEVDTTELMQEEQEQEQEQKQGQEQEQEQGQVEIKEESTLPTIWHGRVNMPQVAEFQASARQIGGRPLTESEWQDVLSPTMWIEGRIPADRVTNYVTQTQYSTSREIVLLEVEANAQDQPQSQTLLQYLDSRSRYAVVGHNKTKIKDFYLVPLYQVQQVPDFLYVVRVEETKRKSDLFLGVLVLSKHQPSSVPPPVIQPQQPQQQQQPKHQLQYPSQPAAYPQHNNYDYQPSYGHSYKPSY